MGNNVMRKLCAGSLAVVLGAALMAVGAHQALADDLSVAAVVAGKTDLTTPETSGITCTIAKTTSGSVTWDAKTNTVTMKNATLDLDAAKNANAYYGIMVNGDNAKAKPAAVTLKLIGKNVIKGGRSLFDAVYVKGANLTVSGGGQLSVNTPAASAGSVFVDGDLTVSSGAIRVTGGDAAFYCTKDLALNGGSLAVKKSGKTGVQADGAIKLLKGSLTVNDAQEYGVLSWGGNIYLGGASVSMSNTKSLALYAYQGAVSVKAGKVNVNSCNGGIYSAKTFVMNGSKASVSMKNIEQIGVRSKGFVSKAGKLSVAGCSKGIYSDGAIIVSGGTVKVSGVKGDSATGIQAQGGALKISGGAVSSQCVNADKFALYSSQKVSNKAASLKKVKGRVSEGTSFIAGGSTYVKTDYMYVTLKSYGSKSKAPTVNVAKFGGHSYQVNVIGAKAFTTKQGRAITGITIGENVDTVGAKAFYGTSRLTTMKLTRPSTWQWKLNKTAYSKCGKRSGAGLTVKCTLDFDARAMKRIFVAGGMSAKAKFV